MTKLTSEKTETAPSVLIELLLSGIAACTCSIFTERLPSETLSELS
jgi:hypothetical protein